MAKLDFKRELRHLYSASAKTIADVDVPEMRYLMVDGAGDPNHEPSYADAVAALYSVSYAARFLLKRGEPPVDCPVMPLEGLWWADDWDDFLTGNRAGWRWTMMILQPPPVPDATLAAAMQDVANRKNLPALQSLRLKAFAEGPCAQVLHVGPFSEEGPTLERLHAHVDARGARTGKHHEIYLTDVRRAKPENWKTVLRQPLVPQVRNS